MEFKQAFPMPYINREELFNQVELQPDGYGIQWNPQATIMYYELYKMGKTLPLTKDDYVVFANYDHVN